MHLLLFSHYFPPDPEVGGIRAANLADAFLRAGHRVTVIAAALPGETPGVRYSAEGLEVRTVPTLTPPRLLLAAFRSWMTGPSRDAATTPESGTIPTPEGSSGSRLRRWIISIAWVPDDRQRFIRCAVNAAKAVHSRRPVDVVYSTAPPFSVHLAGLLAKRALRIPWVAEYRDPWNDIPKPAPLRSWLSTRIDSWLESAVIRRADRIVTVTLTLARWLQARRAAAGRTEGVVVALNGIPVVDLPPQEEVEELELLHAGTLYLSRDPRAVLEGIASAAPSGCIAGRAVRVSFLGSLGGVFAGVPVAEMARDAGIGELVHFDGQVSLVECRTRMARATCLLLLAQNQPAQIPNKLYDYLAVRRPILAVVDADGESAAVLRAVGGHHILDPSSPLLRQEVAKTLADIAAGSPAVEPSEDALEALSTDRQLGTVVRMLELLMAPDAALPTSSDTG